MKTALLLAFLLVALSVIVNGQADNRPADSLIVAPSKFKLMATNVPYKGETCSPSNKDDKVYSDTSEVIRVGDDVYYQAHRFYTPGRGDGLVVENLASKTCRIYRMFGLAEAAGWFKRKKDEGGLPNATGGLFRVGDTLWMGSNGIGVAVLDLGRKTWSRFDLKSTAFAGDHVFVNYADENYVFITAGEFPVASLHIYSVKQDRWLALKAVSTKLVREYGHTAGMVQVPVNHGVFAKQKHLPIDWTFIGLQVTLSADGKSYLFEQKFSETRTVFEISKTQLEQAFMKGCDYERAVEKLVRPDQSWTIPI